MFDAYVRTKYKLPPTVYYIRAIDPAEAAGHYIGAFEVVDAQGVSFGQAYAGNRNDQKKIKARFEVEGKDKVAVIITAHGLTHKNQLRYGKFKDFA